MTLPAEVKRLINLGRSAYLQVDMQRRHLDPEVGYHLVAEEHRVRVLKNARRCLEAARGVGLPIIHVGTWSRMPSAWGPVDHRNPFWEWQTGKLVPGLNRPRQTGQNVEGSVSAEFIPDLAPLKGELVVVKRRYSAFYGTDLELVLRGLGAETLFICGVNTNNCVLATVFDAFSRDYLVVVIADACGSMNGEDYHRFALMEVEAALGFTVTASFWLERVIPDAGKGLVAVGNIPFGRHRTPGPPRRQFPGLALHCRLPAPFGPTMRPDPEHPAPFSGRLLIGPDGPVDNHHYGLALGGQFPRPG